MTDLADPMTPANCDLTDFSFMPLDVRRLRDSRLSASVNGEEFRAAVLLWCAAWHQIPAASLPDDDIELSQLSGFGRVVKEWRSVRAGALHGWVKCSDGRLYHPVVAEKANDAWHQKRIHAWSRECDRLRKENKRRKEVGETELGMPARPERNAVGLPTEFHRISDDGREDHPAEYHPSGRLPEERTEVSEGIPAENPLKGEGQGEGEGKKKESPPASPTDSPRAARRGRDDEPPGFDQFWAVYPRREDRRGSAQAFANALKRGATLEAILAALERRVWPEARYIPHPSTWLNGSRWLDDVDAANAAATAPAPSPRARSEFATARSQALDEMAREGWFGAGGTGDDEPSGPVIDEFGMMVP